MAYIKCALLLALPLLLLSATSPVHAQSGPLLGVNLGVNLNVSSQLFCTPNGNLVPGATPLANVTVALSCGGVNSNLATAVTDAQGRVVVAANLTIAVAEALSTVLNLATGRCGLIVNLPVANCPALPSSGTLRSQLTSTANPRISVNLTAGPYTRVSTQI